MNWVHHCLNASFSHLQVLRLAATRVRRQRRTKSVRKITWIGLRTTIRRNRRCKKTWARPLIHFSTSHRTHCERWIMSSTNALWGCKRHWTYATCLICCLPCTCLPATSSFFTWWKFLPLLLLLLTRRPTAQLGSCTMHKAWWMTWKETWMPHWTKSLHLFHMLPRLKANRLKSVKRAHHTTTECEHGITPFTHKCVKHCSKLVFCDSFKAAFFFWCWTYNQKSVYSLLSFGKSHQRREWSEHYEFRIV